MKNFVLLATALLVAATTASGNINVTANNDGSVKMIWFGASW
jgi:redox-regulated HSP33 family molecular chaperone